MEREQHRYPNRDMRGHMKESLGFVSFVWIKRIGSFKEAHQNSNLHLMRTYLPEEEAGMKKHFVNELSMSMPKERAEYMVDQIWKCSKNVISKEELKKIKAALKSEFNGLY